MPTVQTRPERTATVWVRSKPSQSTLDRVGDPTTPAGRRRLAQYGNVWHEARSVRGQASTTTPLHELHTRCGKDVPDFWDPKIRKSRPTKLKENERLCLVCTRVG